MPTSSVGSPGFPCPSGDSAPLAVSDLARLFFAHGLRGLAPSTCKTYRQYLKRFCEKFGHVPVPQLSLFEVFTWLGQQPGWKSPSTFATVDRCLKRLFNWGIRFGLLAKSPVAGLPTSREAHRRNWKDREFIRVIRLSTPSFKRLVYFMAWTGARPGEVRQIRWDDIDWDRSCIMLGKHKTATTQRQSKPRQIILIPVAVRLLKWIAKHRCYAALVFLNDHERAWTCANICRRIERIRRRIDLPKDLKPYGLRHRFGTEAVRRGLDLKTLSTLMGHDSIRHTEKYVHISGDTSHLIEAARRATGRMR